MYTFNKKNMDCINNLVFKDTCDNFLIIERLTSYDLIINVINLLNIIIESIF